MKSSYTPIGKYSNLIDQEKKMFKSAIRKLMLNYGYSDKENIRIHLIDLQYFLDDIYADI